MLTCLLFLHNCACTYNPNFTVCVCTCTLLRADSRCISIPYVVERTWCEVLCTCTSDGIYNVYTSMYLWMWCSWEPESLNNFSERQFDTHDSQPHSHTAVRSLSKRYECAVTRFWALGHIVHLSFSTKSVCVEFMTIIISTVQFTYRHTYKWPLPLRAHPCYALIQEQTDVDIK